MLSVGDILVKAGLMVNAGQTAGANVPVATSGQTATVNGDVATPIVITQNSTSDQYEAFTVQVGPSPVIVVNKDPGRNKVSIRNSGTQNVYIGRQEVISQGGGFLLTPGSSHAAETTAAVFAIAPSTTNTTPNPLSVWSERDSGN